MVKRNKNKDRYTKSTEDLVNMLSRTTLTNKSSGSKSSGSRSSSEMSWSKQLKELEDAFDESERVEQKIKKYEKETKRKLERELGKLQQTYALKSIDKQEKNKGPRYRKSLQQLVNEKRQEELNRLMKNL